MAKRYVTFILALFLLPLGALSQEDPPMEEEDEGEVVDYTQLVQTTKNKAFCSSRILGQLPIKLVSLGYDFQTQHSLQAVPDESGVETTEHNIYNAQGVRFALNYPVISKNYFLLNLGVNYAETNYSFVNTTRAENEVLSKSLSNNGLRTMGFTATAFKPLNIKRYLIAQFGLNLNGDYSFANMQSTSYLRYTGALIYGTKANDRKIWGFGVSRTYLGGALNYVPVYYMLYTAQNKKWGLEMLLPARFQYRRNVNPKNFLLFGWEVEGNTFRINNENGPGDLLYNDLELRRSELRLRATWDHALSSQIWLSVQAGYRYNWSFDVDRGDFFRPFGDTTPYLIENDFSNPAYFNISINWVSP